MNPVDEFLSSIGYPPDGAKTVEAVAAWMTANNVEVEGDWQSLFKSAEPPAEGTKSFNANDLILKAKAAKADQLERENAELRRKAKVAEKSPRVVAPENHRHKAARDAYVQKVKAGRARFADADKAEAWAAAMRLNLMNSGGIERNYAARADDLAIVGKAYSTIENEKGGYLVVPEYSAEVLYMTEAYGTARKLASEVRMSSDKWEGPRQTSIGVMTPRAEGASVTSTQGTVDLVTLIAKTASARMQWTREFFADSAVSIADNIAKQLAEAFAIRVDQDYFNGDGSGTYNGHVGLKNLTTDTGGRITTVNGAGGWGAITYGNILDLMATPINVTNPNGLVFACSRQFFFSTLMRITYGLAKAQTDRPIADPSPVGGGDASLMGLPLYFSQVMPTATANAQRCLYFGDFAGASKIGIREELDLMQSEHTSAANGMIDLYAHARYAVNIHGHGRSDTAATGMIAALLTTA